MEGSIFPPRYPMTCRGKGLRCLRELLPFCQYSRSFLLTNPVSFCILVYIKVIGKVTD
jgi:hypothetical protein